MKARITLLLLAYFVFPLLAYAQKDKDSTFQKYDTGSFPVFDNCFELYVSPGVIQNWGDFHLAAFINKALDSDTTNTYDIFPIVWNYFNPNDLDSNSARIKFVIGDVIFTKIRHFLYDPNDAQDCQNQGFNPFCRGYSWYAGGNTFFSPIRARYGGELLYPDNPRVLGTYAHELQHLCNAASTVYDDSWVDETKSELARLIAGFKKINIGVYNYNIPFDNSLPCFFPGPTYTSKYWHWTLWAIYLYEQFAGPTNYTYDDLWYQHIRRDSASCTGMYSISRMFEREEFQKYGLSGDQLLREVFANWAVANLLDDTTLEDGKYGYRNLDIPNEIGFLKVNSGNPDTLQNCGLTPALHSVDTSFIDNPHTYSLVYGKDSVLVYLYSADYIRFLADTSLDSQKSYELNLRLGKNGLESTPNISFVAKAVILDQNGEVLSVEKLYDLPDAVAINISDFGKQIKEVVLVICATEDQVSEGHDRVENSRQSYAYSVELAERTGVEYEKESNLQKAKSIQSHPNPFNTSMIISFRSDKNEEVELTVYNVLGQRVFSSRNMAFPGMNRVEWDGRDDSGKNLPSGIYISNLKTKDSSLNLKLILLR